MNYQAVKAIVQLYNDGHEDKLTLVSLPKPTETVNQLADRLARGETVLARSGQRGQLVGLLKKRTIYARSKVQPSGDYLFTPSAKREFKA